MDDPLLEVLTVTEAALVWRKHPKTIRRAIESGRVPLRARKSPDDERGCWLILRESVIARWGERGEDDQKRR